MSVEFRAYDNEHGDPVVVLVATGTYDVSRFVGLHAGARCEDHERGERMREAVRRHRGGRAALKLLRDHGGPDFTDASADLAEKLHALCDRHEWNAVRWEDPLPVPGWVEEVRALLPPRVGSQDPRLVEKRSCADALAVSAHCVAGGDQ